MAAAVNRSPAARPRAEEEEHQGEVRLRLHGERREDLFVAASRALAALMAEGDDDLPEPYGTGDADEGRVLTPSGAETLDAVVEVEARDVGGLLVGFVDELVYLAETRGIVAADCVVESSSATRVRARVVGRRPRRWKTAVKAATYHDLAVDHDRHGWEATVVLDV